MLNRYLQTMFLTSAFQVVQEQHNKIITMQNEREQFLVHMEHIQTQNDDLLLSLNSFAEESEVKSMQAVELSTHPLPSPPPCIRCELRTALSDTIIVILNYRGPRNGISW